MNKKLYRKIFVESKKFGYCPKTIEFLLFLGTVLTKKEKIDMSHLKVSTINIIKEIAHFGIALNDSVGVRAAGATDSIEHTNLSAFFKMCAKHKEARSVVIKSKIFVEKQSEKILKHNRWYKHRLLGIKQ